MTPMPDHPLDPTGTPTQEAHRIVELLLQNYFDVGQPFEDYSPGSESYCRTGGIKRANAVHAALEGIQTWHITRSKQR